MGSMIAAVVVMTTLDLDEQKTSQKENDQATPKICLDSMRISGDCSKSAA